MTDYRDRLFSEYYESSYKHGNILTPEQFELSAQYYERDYQGLMPAHKDAAMLDFGCGVGDFLFYAKKKGYTNYYGIDISKQQVDYCKTHISDRTEFIDGKSFLKDKETVYDLITAHDVLEHVPKGEVMAVLGLIHHALKKGGTLIIRVPNMSNPFGLDARFNDFTHEVGFTTKSLHQILTVAGFTHIEFLPPRAIPVDNIKNLVRKAMVRSLQQLIRFCFYIQDYTVPKNLDKNIVVVARK